jgi:hypothetical protein
VREALRRGEITARKAEVIQRVVVRDRQTFWILRAKEDAVRGLRKSVNAPRVPEDEELVSVSLAVAAEDRPAIDEGLRWGGIVLGHRSRKAQRVEAWGQEYFGAHAAPAEDGADAGANDMRFQSRPEEDLDSLKGTTRARKPALGGPRFHRPAPGHRLQRRDRSLAHRRGAEGADGDAQMCARGVFTFAAAPHVFELLKDAFRAFQALARRAISTGKCLAEMASPEPRILSLGAPRGVCVNGGPRRERRRGRSRLAQVEFCTPPAEARCSPEDVCLHRSPPHPLPPRTSSPSKACRFPLAESARWRAST